MYLKSVQHFVQHFIMSPYDIRFVTLIGVAIDLAEELALVKGGSPEEHVNGALYLANKRIHKWGEEKYMNQLISGYSILKEAIT